MKFIIWLSFIFAYALLTTLITQSGVFIGVIPTCLLFSSFYTLAMLCCKAWDIKQFEKKYPTERLNEELVEFIETCKIQFLAENIEFKNNPKVSEIFDNASEKIKETEKAQLIKKIIKDKQIPKNYALNIIQLSAFKVLNQCTTGEITAQCDKFTLAKEIYHYTNKVGLSNGYINQEQHDSSIEYLEQTLRAKSRNR